VSGAVVTPAGRSPEPRLQIRSATAGDDVSGLEPLWGEPLVAGTPVAPGAVLVASGPRPLGLVRTRAMPPGVRVDELHAEPGHAAAVLSAAVAAEPAPWVELLVRDPSDRLDVTCEEAGLRLVLRQIRVGDRLEAVTRPARRRFTFRSVREVGQAGCLALLRHVWSGDTGPTGLPAEIELERLLAVARPATGAPADTSRWRLAYHGGAPAGVALIQALPGAVGTLLYFGVVPEFRGCGLGRALHAEALWAMRAAGLVRYQDATGYDNAPMRAIFAGAGCEPIGSAAMFVRSRDGVVAAVRQPPQWGRRLARKRHAGLLRTV
jgi:GNAT superfamily N-acetyltransferase